MSYERETMQQIRAEVDRYDRYHGLGEDTTIGTSSNTTEPRVYLCSEVRRRITISAYGVILSEDLGIKDFVTPLLNLLQGRIGTNATFNQVSYWISYHLHITDLVGQYVLLMPSLLSMPRDW
jgi:hypothetical protein